MWDKSGKFGKNIIQDNLIFLSHYGIFLCFKLGLKILKNYLNQLIKMKINFLPIHIKVSENDKVFLALESIPISALLYFHNAHGNHLPLSTTWWPYESLSSQTQ